MSESQGTESLTAALRRHWRQTLPKEGRRVAVWSVFYLWRWRKEWR